jgi:hypothetical protein
MENTTDKTMTDGPNNNTAAAAPLPPHDETPSAEPLTTNTSPTTADQIVTETSGTLGDIEHGEGDEGAVGGEAVGQGGSGAKPKEPQRSSSRDRKPSQKAIEKMLDDYNGSIEKLRLHSNKAYKLIAELANLKHRGVYSGQTFEFFPGDL